MSKETIRSLPSLRNIQTSLRTALQLEPGFVLANDTTATPVAREESQHQVGHVVSHLDVQYLG